MEFWLSEQWNTPFIDFPWEFNMDILLHSYCREMKIWSNLITILLHLTNTFAELLYCFCILLIKECSIETGVQSPHWMLCEKRIIPAQYHLSTVVVEMAKENRWSDALATKANAGKGGKQSRNVTNIKCICLNFLMYKAKQASKKCDTTKKCSQVRWKWYQN